MRPYRLLILFFFSFLAVAPALVGQNMRLELKITGVYFDRGNDPFNKPDPSWKVNAIVAPLGIVGEECIHISNTSQGFKNRESNNNFVFQYNAAPSNWPLNGQVPLLVSVDGWENDRGSNCSYDCCGTFTNDDDARNQSSGSVIIGNVVQKPGDTYEFSVGSRYRVDLRLSLIALDVYDGSISASAGVNGPNQNIFCAGETVTLDADLNAGNYSSYALQWQKQTGSNSWQDVGTFTNRDYIQVSAEDPFPVYRMRNTTGMDEPDETDGWRYTSALNITVGAPPPNVNNIDIVTPVYCAGETGIIRVTDVGGGVDASANYSFTLTGGDLGVPLNIVTPVSGLPIEFDDLNDGNYSLTIVESGIDSRCAAVVDNMSNPSGTNTYELQQSGSVIYTRVTASSSVAISNVAPGTYDVVVRNGNGCENAPPYPQVTVNEPEVLEAIVNRNPTGSTFDVACFGDEIEMIVNVTGGNGTLYTVTTPDVFRRSVSPITVSVPNNDGGNTTMTVSDQLGCTFEIELGAITQPPSAIEITEDGVTSTGDCAADGTAQFTATGGVSPYTYYVDNDLTTSNSDGDFNMLTGGDHTVFVLDDNGCIRTQAFTIPESSALSLSVTNNTSTTCFGFSDGEFTLQASGGVPPYQYSIDGGTTFTGDTPAGISVTYDNLTAGPYDVIVRDSEPSGICELGRIVTVSQPAEIAIADITFTPITCSGDLADIRIDMTEFDAVYQLGFGGGPQGQISIDGGATYNTLDAVFLDEAAWFIVEDFLSGGSYDITLQGADGCFATNTFSITIEDPGVMAFTETPTSTDEICFEDNNGTITATVSGGRSPYYFSLYNNGVVATSGPVVSANGVATYTFSGLAPEAAVQGNGNTGYAVGITDGSELYGAVGSCSVVYPPSYDTLSFTLGSASETMIGIVPAPELQIITMTDVGPLLNCVNGSGDNGIVEVTTVTGGYPPYEYSSDGIAYQSDNTLTDLSVNPEIWVRDANGCVVSADFFGLQYRDEITTSLTLLESATTCTKGSISVSLTNGVGPYLIEVFTTPSGLGCEGPFLFFSDGDPYTSFETSNTTFTIDELEGDTYELAIYDLGTACGYCSNGSITVPLLSPLTAQITGTTEESCDPGSDGSISISITGGEAPYTTDINFSDPQTGSTPTFSGLTANTPYTFRVTDNKGCEVLFSGSVDVVTVLDISATTVDVSTCAGDENGTVTAQPINGTAPYTVTWNYDGETVVLGAGETTTKTNLPAGEYEFSILDANGCTAELAVYLFEPDSIKEDIVLVQDASCLGLADGSISLAVTGGSGTLAYSLNGGIPQNTGDFPNLEAGDYTITVSDDNGCSFEFMYTVNAGSSISATASVSDATCGGFSDGSITLFPADGTAPYEYALDGMTFSSDNPITGLTAGTYEVTVRDANGCTFVLSDITVGEASPLMATVNVVQDASCTEAFGILEVVVTGGTEPYSYEWDGDPALDQSTLDPATSGDHTVVVTDANGCTISAMGTISTITPVFINLVSSTDEICDMANGTITVEATGGLPPYSFAWSNGNPDSPTATDLTAGSYTITVTDANTCTAEITVDIANIAGPTPDPTVVNSFCTDDNGSITVGVIDGTAPFTYSLNGGIPQGDPLFDGLAAGTYTILVEDANGCTGSTTATVEFIPPPTLNLIITDAACDQDDGEILVGVIGDTGPYTYLWSPGGATTSSLSDLAPGDYTVTVIDANGCEAVETATVGEIAAPVVTVESTTDATCGDANGTATVAVTGGTAPYTYDWSIANPSVPSVSNLPTGTHSVIVTDARGCEVIRFVNIGDEGGPTAINLFAEASFCEDGNGSIEVTVTGGTEPYTYAWDHDQDADGPIVTDLFFGTYTVTVTDANGCTIIGSELVDFIPGPLLDAPVVSNSICVDGNGSITINVLDGTAPFTFTWDNGIGVAGATIENLSVGTYNVTVTDVDGCTATASANVILEAGPVLFIDQALNENCDQADGVIEVALLNTTGTPPFDYDWDHDPTLDGPLATGLTAGTYSVTVTDANGCTDELSQTLTNEPGITLQEGPVESDICGQGVGSAVVLVDGGSGPFTYEWDGLPAVDGNTATDLLAGTYTVTVTDVNGCSASLDITVGEIAGPTIVFDSSTEDPCVANDVTAVVVSTEGTPPYSYSWSHDLGLDSPVAVGLGTDSYTVTVTDDNGCTNTVSFDVVDNSAPTVSVVDFANATCVDGTGSITIAIDGGLPPYDVAWDHDATATELSLTDLVAGTYTATVTDANGCTAMVTQEILFVPGPQITIIDQMAPSCGVDDGFIDAFISGGTEPYTVEWEHNGDASTLQINLGAGDYTINVTDANGCTASETIVLTAPPGVEAEISNVTPELCGQADGTISINVITTSGPFTYSWSHDNTLNEPTATGLPTDDYSVTISADGLCDIVLNTTLNEVEGPSLSDPTVIDSDCNASNGSVSFVASGGTPPYTYSWSHNAGLDSPDATGIPAGVYTLTVTDANGCTAEASATVSDRDAPMTDATLTNPSCENDNGSISVTVSGGVAPYTYDWSHDMDLDGPDATGLAAGDYTLTVTDVNGCASINTYTLTIDDPIIINILVQQNSLCTDGNGAISLETTGGTAPYTYDWSHDAMASGSSQTGLNAGDYTIIVTDQSSCTASVDITIELEGSPSLTLVSTTDAICDEAGSITVSAANGTAPYSYSWSHDAGLDSPTADDLAVSDYTVTVTDANGCEATLDVSLGGTSVPELTANTTDPFCAEDSGSIEIVATGAEPFTYAWSHDDTASGSTLTGLLPGDYTITVTDVNGCSSTLTTSLTYSGGPMISITNQQNSLCTDDNGSISVQVSDGVEPYTYSWSHDGGLNAATATGLSAGTYGLTVTDANGCYSSISVELTFTAGPSLSWESVMDASCAEDNGALTVMASDGLPPYSYSWSHNIGLDSPTATNLAAGDYTVSVTDANGCTVELSNTVSAADLLIIFPVQVQPTCNGIDDGSVTAEVSGGIGPYNFVWSTGQTGETISDLAAGTYFVTVTDTQGCQASASVEIFNLEALDLVFDIESPLCNSEANGTAMVSVANGSGTYTYLWDTPGNPETAGVTGLAAGDYNVTVTDENGCFEVGTATVPETPELTVSTNSTVSCLNLLNGTATASPENGQGPFTYAWNDIDDQTTATAVDLAPGVYVVTVTDANGCMATATALVDGAAAVEIEISSVVQPDCISNPSGSATVNVLAGSGSYEFLWDDPAAQTSPTATGLNPGTYNVTVTDLNGCFTSASVTIEAAGQLELLTTSVVPPTCVGDTDGSATVQVANGSGTYTYLWDDANGQNTNTLSDVPAGIYTVTITDQADGCFITEVVEINDPSPVTITLSEVNGPSCGNNDDGNALVVPDGGTGVYTYNWDDPAMQSTAFVQDLMPGDYNVTVMDENGCTASLMVTIPEGTDLEAAIDDFSSPSCFGIADGTATVMVDGSSGNLTYQWDDPAFQQTQQATGLNPGTYNVTVTDDGGCEAFATVEVPATPELIVNLEMATSPSCSGFTDGQLEVSITGGTGAVSILWDDPAAQSTAIATGLASGDYTVTVIDENGCQTVQSYTLEDAVALAISGDAVDPTCFNSADGELTANVNGGTGPYTYEWDDAGAQTEATATGLTTGTYSVTATDANGCTISETFELTTTAAEITLAETIVDPSCEGGNDGSISVVAGGGAGALTYEWNTGSAESTLSGLLAGDYILTITDGAGCTQEGTYELVEGSPFVIDLGEPDTTICSGEVLYYDFSDQGYSLTWTSDQGFNSTDEVVLLEDAGTYTLDVINEAGCAASDQITLNLGSEAFQALFLLPTDVVVNSDVAAVEVSWPAPQEVEWFYDQDSVNLVNTIQNQYLFNFPYVGTFDLTMRAVADGCEDWLTKSIVVHADSTTIPSPFQPTQELLQFSMSPNPNNGVFEVVVELTEAKPIVLSIFNAAGVEQDRRILSGQALYEENYSLGLTSGIYVCILQTPTQRKSILFTVAVP